MSKEKVLEELYNVLTNSNGEFGYPFFDKTTFSKYMKKVSEDSRHDFLSFRLELKDYYILTLRNADVRFGEFFDKEEAIEFLEEERPDTFEYVLFKTSPAEELTYSFRCTINE